MTDARYWYSHFAMRTQAGPYRREPRVLARVRNRPIYSGRDAVVRYDIPEIEAERPNGYAWLGTWPAALVDEEYPAWRARVSGLSVK